MFSLYYKIEPFNLPRFSRFRKSSFSSLRLTWNIFRLKIFSTTFLRLTQSKHDCKHYLVVLICLSKYIVALKLRYTTNLFPIISSICPFFNPPKTKSAKKTISSNQNKYSATTVVKVSAPNIASSFTGCSEKHGNT